MKDQALEKQMTDFLANIGIPHHISGLSEETRLPGLRISAGTIQIDSDRLAWPGDILYAAGLLAMAPPSERMTLTCAGKPEPGLELPAMAWAYAAAKHLSIDPMIVFHEGGYQNGGRDIAAQFQGPRPIGVPMLVWLGLSEPGRFPEMASWIREIESP